MPKFKTIFEDTLQFAKKLDQSDPLSKYRQLFHMPKNTSIYLSGNSLGLQPKTTKFFINEELNDWKNLGAKGHLQAKRPWVIYHKLAKKTLAQLTGAKTSEVVAMNQLTINLHLLMVSFYRPTKQRYKILTEAGAFSSNQYAYETQLKFHGLDPAEALIEIKPRPGEFTLQTKDILDFIEQRKDQLALVILGGVQFYTGQFFDIKAITLAAHQAGALAGFDLAHAIGNVPLNLHDDDVDFAVWCSYKYLNSGPGSIGGAYVHERHAKSFDLPRFAGWWGHNEHERFLMQKGFKPMEGVDGWQVSNFPVLSGAAHLASLEIFQQAGYKNLRKKSIMLTGFLEFLLKKMNPDEQYFKIITPSAIEQRGCQLSLLIKSNGKKTFLKLIKKGIVADWREPGVIRIAPVPLYNTFQDVFHFVEILKQSL
jgi:kynureninase